MKTHTSLVQKLISRSVTGQGLALSVHAHTGLTIHLSKNPGVRTGVMKRLFPQSFSFLDEYMFMLFDCLN
jgi:hypothetical protein